MYKLRTKYNFLVKDPWSCIHCMTYWTTSMLTWMFMPSHWIINIIYSAVLAIYFYSKKKIEEYKSTLNNTTDESI